MPRSRSTASKASPRKRAKAATAVRIHEAVGTSTTSWDAAVVDAVRGAKDDAPRAITAEVARLWADLDPKRGIRQYRAAVKIAYPVTLTSAPARRRSAARR